MNGARLIISGLGLFGVAFCVAMLICELIAWFRPSKPEPLMLHDSADNDQPTHKLAA